MTLAKHCKTSIAIAALFASAGAFAATMNHADYAAQKDRIEADYKSDKNACDSYSHNQKDVCVEQAQAKEKIAKADLEYNYTGKQSDWNKAAVVKADANYDVAKEMCDDKGGNAKDVCVAEAKATHKKALADAKMSKKVDAARNSQSASRLKTQSTQSVSACTPQPAAVPISCCTPMKSPGSRKLRIWRRPSLSVLKRKAQPFRSVKSCASLCPS